MEFKLYSLICLIGIATMWSSCKGIDKYANKTNSQKQSTTADLKIDQTIWSIYQDKKSNYWFGTKTKGVFFYDGRRLLNYTTQDGLISDEIRGIQEDTNGNVYFETTSGVSKYDGNSFSTLEVLEGSFLSQVWTLNQNDLWFRIGFQKEGPYRYDGEHLYFHKFPKSPYDDEIREKRPNMSFSPYGVYSIYKDSKGHMWFGTTAMGLCRFDGENIDWMYEDQLQTTLNGGDFGTRSILEDQDGNYWINNTKHRFKMFSSNEDYKINYKKQMGLAQSIDDTADEFPFFLSIIEDDHGDIWMATYDNGVWRNNGKELIHYPIKDGATDVQLFTIYKDNSGSIWLGSHNAGVFKYNGKSFVKFEALVDG